MRYHGLDLHKGSSAVSIRDEVGHEVRYLAKVETVSYVATLGPQDSVALESCAGTFWWAERIQRRGARCVVIDPYRFRIIRDSWHKTDRHDAGALSLGLWTAAQSGALVLPEVWQPTPEVRELRRLFSQWQILNNQSRQLKAQVQSVLVENGITERKLGIRMVDNPAVGLELIATLELSPASLFGITMSLKTLAHLKEQKKSLQREIYRAGQPFEEQVRLLIGIRGVTPLLALGFLSEVGDIHRFRSLRALLAYLGVVPTVRSSGGTAHVGRLNRRSRSLARTLFTEAVLHLADSSPLLGAFFRELVQRKGYGRARIGDIVKCCGREFQSVPSIIRFQGGIRIPTLSRSFVVGPPLRSFFLLSQMVASLSHRRSHVRRLPEVHRRRTAALASRARSVCAP